MATMFINVSQAAGLLNVSESEVIKMSDEGFLQRYKDGDAIMFKRVDVESLAPEPVQKQTAVSSLSNLSPVSPNRLSMGIPAFDAQFGGGPPLGKVSILSGESGLGKSRLATTLAKHLNLRKNRIYYLTTELPPAEFMGEKLAGYHSETFFINRTKSLKVAVSDIIATNPRWVVIDSINLIKEFRGGRGGEDIIDGFVNKDGSWQNGLRWAAEQTNSHICCISQQNADGSVKGGTEFTHMGDIAIYLNKVKDAPEGVFQVRFGKNRYGKSGDVTYWQHDNVGVTCLGSEKDWEVDFVSMEDAIYVPPPEPVDELAYMDEMTAEDMNRHAKGLALTGKLTKEEIARFERGRYDGILGKYRWFVETINRMYLD